MTTPVSSALVPAGPQADRIETLWSVFLWVSVVVFALVVAFELAAIARAHLRRRHEGLGDPLIIDRSQERRMVRVIAGCGAVTVITLGLLLGASIGASRALAGLDTRDAVRIKITGHQWWWEIEYEDLDPSKTFVTANELHLPVGRPVMLDLTSNDVIHSFWIPALHGKRDLIPGRINHTQLRVDRAGVFSGMCAEFCGLEHAKMALTVVAEPEADFEAWLDAARAPAPEPTGDLARRGRDVFMNGTCKMCHAIGGTEAGATLGPDLTHVFGRRRLAGNSIPDTTGWLAGWILDPQDIKPGVKMPPSPMQADDLQALLAYLETLQ